MNDRKILELINHVRMCKKAFLMCKLVGGSQRKEIDAFKDLHQVSQMKWTFCGNRIDVPSKRAFQAWKLFAIWLK